ncbi:uncharacterized protein LOC141607662 [Silene latifolia]|uniref:uncharacterized protein LOC141607662 n=1 Tax=Silene latifolia TaxID=37657 RepID=UPI003D7747F4
MVVVNGNESMMMEVVGSSDDARFEMEQRCIVVGPWLGVAAAAAAVIEFRCRAVGMMMNAEADKVNIAAYFLEKEADRWWAMIGPTTTLEPRFGWEIFKILLEARFYPAQLKHQKMEEFLNFKQGDLSVQEYTDKFNALAHFAEPMIPNEAQKTFFFRQGIKAKIQGMVRRDTNTFARVYDEALWAEGAIEAVRLESVAETAKSSKRPFTPSTSQPYSFKKGKHGNQKGFQKNVSIKDKVCYNCQKTYHPGRYCKGNPLGCYNCKEQGHKAADCPKKDITPAIANVPIPKGRIFMMSRAKAEAHPDVITGMFTVSDIPAYILFDTGASLSFISASFAKKAALVSHSAETTPISLPSGEVVSCSTVFKDVPIFIAGSILPATLICFSLAEFDIILGMDWLSRYDARFQCRDQKIFLKSPCGTKLTYNGMRIQPGIKLISAINLIGMQRNGHQVHLCVVTNASSLPKLEDVPVVNEYADVFPDELSGIPSKRDVEFAIDLLPGTRPIAKAPYRMTPIELQELKK